MSEPDSTAVRVALWRALHVEIDAPPHVLEDEIGLQLVDPEDGWRDRPDMYPENTSLFRASIVARARFMSATELNARYSADRSDGLHTSSGEELLVAPTGPQLDAR